MMLDITIGIQILCTLLQQIPDGFGSNEPLFITEKNAGDSLPVYGYQIINEYPHDTDAFTQGLCYKDGFLYEGTGLYGESSLRKIDLSTGTVLKIHLLESQFFGEGVAIHQDTIRQLTWRNDTGFIYVEQDTFMCIGGFPYTTEGWGLTNNDTCLIMSDGTPIIRFLDPHTYQVIGQITVTAESVEIQRINELEYIQGKIFANVWYSDSIAVIDPDNGQVLYWIDCTGLLSSPPNVLNGIAFDPVNIRLFVTGKLWPTVFDITADPINYPPQIIGYYPNPPCSITTDSSLQLYVSAIDPDPQDSLSFTWQVNGIIDTTAYETTYVYTRTTPAIDTISAHVTDGMYSDSITWIVYVSSVGIKQQETSKIRFDIRIPNPYVRDKTITFALSCPHHVKITVYDVLGRETEEIIDENFGSGTYCVGFKRINVPGVYFLYIQIDDEEYIRKVIFIY